MLPKNQNGAAALEFLIVLPFLLMLLFGGIEFGAIFYNKQVITNASREGARAGITREYTKAEIENIVNTYWLNEKKENFLLAFSPITLEVKVDPEDFITDPTNEYLRVGVTIEKYKLVFASLIGIKESIKLSASTTMHMEPELN